MIKPKYSIGDKGERFEIVGVLTPEIATVLFHSNNINLEVADNNWRNHAQYILKLKEPKKNVTIDDLQRLYPEKSYRDIEILYESAPLIKNIVYTESIVDDLFKNQVNAK